MRIADRATQRQIIEAMLAEYGISGWKYDDAIPLTEIDKDRSLHNQVRNNPLIPENVDSMTMALKSGADLPPILVTREGKKHLVWSGNNRTAAHIGAGRRSIPGYILPSNIQPEVLRMLAVEDNRGGTWANTKEERLEHALDLLSTDQFTTRALAQRLDLSESEINAERAQRVGRSRATRLGVLKSWERVGKTSRPKFEQITMDEPYAAALVLAADAGLKIELVNELVNGAKEITTGVAEQLAFIERKRQGWEERISAVRAGMNPDRGPARVYDVRTMVIMTHGHLTKFSEEKIIQHIKALPDTQREDAIRRLHEAANRLMNVALAFPQSPNGEATGKTQPAKRAAKAPAGRG